MTEQPLQKYLDALGAAVVDFKGNPATVIANAVADSRKVSRQGLFVAIAGAQLDGTEFIPQAIAAGAVAVIAEKRLKIPSGISFIQVKNAYQAAGIAAEVFHQYPIRKMKAVGITGTNGKTTCAFLLREILRRAGCKTGLIGTVQYEIGDQTIAAERTTPTPFELQEIIRQMAAANVDWLIMEVSSHALAQQRLGETGFQGGLFTNLTGDHCDYHLTMENYFQAKKKLFTDHLQHAAPALINHDDPWGEKLLIRLKNEGQTVPLAFGINRKAEYQIGKVDASLHGTSFTLQSQSMRPLYFTTPLIGKFNISNLAGTAALANELKIPGQVIKETVADFKGAPGRLELVPGNQDFRVFVDYAHTDDALKNVLSTLRALNPSRLILVFGCGGDRDRGKRPRMGKIAARMADRIYLTSDNPRSEEPHRIIEEIKKGMPVNSDCVTIENRAQAISRAIKDAKTNDVVLIAGKGHENYQIIGRRQLHFDDREEAHKALLK